MLCSRDAGFVDMYVDESVEVYADAYHFGHFHNFEKWAKVRSTMYGDGHETALDIARPSIQTEYPC